MTTRDGKRVKVLVVDDNEDFCENIKDLIEAYDYQAATAYNGSRAIELVKQDSPDVILLDVRMPGMDGLAAFRKITEIDPSVAVFLITGYADDEVIKEAMREGVRGCMRKPLDMPRLLDLIQKTVSASG